MILIGVIERVRFQKGEDGKISLKIGNVLCVELLRRCLALSEALVQ